VVLGVTASTLGFAVVDAHVHFWDPSVLRYPWHAGLPTLRRPFLAADYASATAGIAIDGLVLIEANALPDETLAEVDLFENQTGSESLLRPRTPTPTSIVAYASLTTTHTFDRTLDALSARPSVRGIRHNIQGEAPGFCTQPSFAEGVRKVGSRGLVFDLCATHDQLSQVIQLVRACPNTRFVLDHCGKPAIRDRLVDPWRADIARLAECENVWCKISGLVTEASHASWREEDLVPYASHVVERSGTDRVIYGSDWPVLSLAAQYADWFRFTERFTASWTPDEQRGFYRDNAIRVYALQSN